MGTKELDVYEETTVLLKAITLDVQKMLKEVLMKTSTKRLNISTKYRKAITNGLKDLASCHKLLETPTHKKDGILTWIKNFHEKN